MESLRSLHKKAAADLQSRFRIFRGAPGRSTYFQELGLYGVLRCVGFEYLAGLACARPVGSGLVAGRAVHAGSHACHDRQRDDLPAPPSGAPRARPAPCRFPFLPLLAVVHDRHRDARVDRRAPQAPRQVRAAGRPAQSGRVRHPQGVLAGLRAVPRRVRERRDRAALRTQHAQGLAGKPPLRAPRLAGPGAAAAARPGAVRRPRAHRVGRAAAVDPGDGRGRDQRHRPLVGLPQLRIGRREHQHLALGPADRRRGTAQQPPHLPDLGQALGEAL